MAFSPDARVKVTNQHSDYRGRLGTVISADDGANEVRLDGFKVNQTVRLLDAELQTTNFESPVEY